MDENPEDGGELAPRREEPSRGQMDRPRLALVTAIIMLVAAALGVISALLPLLH